MRTPQILNLLCFSPEGSDWDLDTQYSDLDSEELASGGENDSLGSGDWNEEMWTGMFELNKGYIVCIEQWGELSGARRLNMLMIK